MLEESLTGEGASQGLYQVGDLVTGTVVKVDGDDIILDIGAKTEGIVPTNELTDDQGNLTVGVGDTVEVVVDRGTGPHDEIKLSRRKAIRAANWKILEAKFEAGEAVTGKITEQVKGGLSVSVMDIRAFLPGSLVDVRPVRDLTRLIGEESWFEIIKMDRRRNNLVVSRKALLERERGKAREELLTHLEEGAVFEGEVKNITDYGAFVDIGGMDGLLHMTDMSWKRIKHPREVVSPGDLINVKILAWDPERERISLGLKQLQSDPWENLDRRYPVAGRFQGQITNVTDYGVFVEIEDGIEGLVHVSEMSWTKKNLDPRKVYKKGDEVEVTVLNIDVERRRISLGMKQIQQNPWEVFAAEYPEGTRIKGPIKNITDFGLFVGLNDDLDGLVHITDLSWDEEGEEAIKKFEVGQEIEAVVLQVKPQQERISLGIKQLSADPWETFFATHKKGDVITGTVKEINDGGVVVELEDGIEGFIRISELAVERIEDPRTVAKVGESITAKITQVDRKTRRIALSIKQKEKDEERQVLDQYKADSSSAATNLGDLIKEKLAQKSAESDAE
ncbi:MAG: 30S ribosomal protein S1 [Proteobacteria bacterium CG1_02_64_396]|nr:MAG: 30S ribosomal protein S1 [Proteobacteria bacterium CG1_02_64_396]